MIKLVDYFVVVGYDDSAQPPHPSDTRANQSFEEFNEPDDHDDEEDQVYGFKSAPKYSKTSKTSAENKPAARGKIIQRFPACPVEHAQATASADAFGGDDTHNTSINSATTNNINMNSNSNQDDYQEFDNNIHCFCQPDKGWRLYTKQEPPNFFVSVLTDIKVKLSFNFD